MRPMREAGGVRRAGTRTRVLAAVVVVLGALAGAAPASAAPRDDARLLDLLRLRADHAPAGARAAAGPAVWPARTGSAARAAAARAGSAVARRTRPARVVVGLRSAASLGAVARRLRARGASVRSADSALALLEVDARSPARVAAVLAGDARVAFLELARTRRLSGGGEGAFAGADPLTGRAYGWAFDRINAEPAIAAAGGGSRDRPVAVVDSGVDLDHPDLAANVRAAHDAIAGEARPRDVVGHGTFVAGLASAVSGNGLGLRGSAGNTPLLAVRAGTSDLVASADIAAGIRWAVANGARVVNLSLGGDGLSLAEQRALDLAFLRDVLPVAAAGNAAEDGNPVQYPAAYLGGWRGGFGIGLSVAATDPAGAHASFSTFNSRVSLAAPGAGGPGCDDGVFSTVPGRETTIFDDDPGCGTRVVGAPDGSAGRYGYLSGTSMAAPLVSGVAALVWKNNRRLASEQVAHLLTRSARQTRGTGWNAFTGAGVVDAAAAWRLARRYDTLDPRAALRLRRRGAARAALRLSGRDRTLRGDELAGRTRFTLYTSRDGRDFRRVAGPSARALGRTFKLSRRRLWVQGMACDRNLNCTVIEHGPLRRR